MSKKKSPQPKTQGVKSEAGSSKPEAGKSKSSSSKLQLPSSPFRLWTLLAVVAITFIALFPVVNNDFINFDDPQYVTENPVIQKLNSETVKLFFTQQFVGNYQPLVMLSYAVQFKFFGMHASGFHFFSLLFHLLNTALVFVLVYHLLRNNTAAIITALLFGIHPLHVESIAWVASQKDVLYSFFLLGSIYFYMKHDEARSARAGTSVSRLPSSVTLPLSYFLFILSVLCKAQAVVLPMVLLVIDLWQKRKITWKMVIQKIPYFIIALSFGFLAVMMQKKAGAVQDYGYFTVVERLLFSSFGFINYMWQTILPIKLSIFYPYPETYDKINTNWVYVAPFIIIAFGALVFWLRNRSRITVFGVLFFCINIALVIQLIPVGDAIHADRYTYISLIGFFIIGGYYFGKYFEEKKNLRPVLIGVGAAYFLGIGVLTFNQSRKWKDSISIYTASIAHHPAPIMYCNRGADLFKFGKFQEAWSDFNEAVIMRPRFPNAFKNRGLAYDQLKEPEKAMADYTSAMRYNPRDLTLYLYRGHGYKNSNRFEEAIKDYTTILTMDSNYSEAYYSRAEAYGRSGKLTEAIADYNKTIELLPKSDATHNNRGIVYSLMKNYPAAISDFSQAIELNPKFWNAYFNRSVAYQNVGDYQNAYNDAVIAKKNDYPINQSYLDQLQAQLRR